MFRRQVKPPAAKKIKSLKNLMKIFPAVQLLADEKRQSLLSKIKALCALDDSGYDSLCKTLVHQLLDYYQNLPETSNSYFSQPGGLVDHALNRTEAALSLFQQFVVLDDSSELSEQQQLWQYALLSAALLQGIGKLYIDYRIHLYDGQGQLLKPWNPLLDKLVAQGAFYDYSFETESDQDFRRRLNLILARRVMPEKGFAWIASEPKVLAVWLALINEDQRSAGTLGAILVRADAIAIQRYFNQWLSMGRGGRGGGLGRVGAFSDSTPESLAEKEQAMGVEFIQWLTQALAEGRLQLNKAPLFMVPGGMLMSSEMFKLFVRENPEFKNWQAVEKGFLSLGVHASGKDGQSMARFEQANHHQIHSGIVFSEYAMALPEQVQVHNMNTGKTTTRSAIELSSSPELSNQFVQAHAAPPQPVTQQLASSGEWKAAENSKSSLQPGTKRGG